VDLPVPRDVAELLLLEPHGPDTFVGTTPPYAWGRIYGGQVIAQGLLAAALTVPDDRPVHSLHAYFILGGRLDEPVRYEVDRVRNGSSFMTRRVIARQSYGAILTLEASFQTEEHAPDVQTVTMPTEVPDPEDLPEGGWGWMLQRRQVPLPHGSARALTRPSAMTRLRRPARWPWRPTRRPSPRSDRRTRAETSPRRGTPRCSWAPASITPCGSTGRPGPTIGCSWT
jgi:acyl-CoA thioesterase